MNAILFCFAKRFSILAFSFLLHRNTSFYTFLFFSFFLILKPSQTIAQNTTFTAGAYVIDMGQDPQTFANGLKPYGLVYDLILNESIPISWVINSSKSKDGVDFSVNGKDYKGGPFIIASEYITTSVLQAISNWEAQGVTVDYISDSFDVPVFHALSSWPRAVLDTERGSIVEAYYNNAGIPTSSYITAGNPTLISNCEDIYVLPHAEPDNWDQSYIDSLKYFIENEKGYLWSACHAVSQLENLANCNFLSTDGLIHWQDHLSDWGENIPYNYDEAYSADPIMQFIGRLDEATNKGSERMYIPKTSWRASTSKAVYDQDHDTYPELAAALIYGRAFGNSDYGMVMYESGHDHNDDTWNGTSNSLPVPESAKVAAQRAYFNFVLLTGVEKEIIAAAIIPDTVSAGTSVNISASASGGVSPYTFVWSSNMGGIFENQSDTETTSSVNYTAPCGITQEVITLKVTDDCDVGRFSIVSKLVYIIQAETPTGDTIQTFCEGATVSDLVANGNAIQWYSSASGGDALAETDLLADGSVLYYASQIVDGCESPTRLAVHVYINSVSGGTVADDQVACPFASSDPFTEIVSASGSGTLSYQWYSVGSEDNIIPDASDFNKIPFFSNSATYSPPGLQAFYVFYKRVVTSTLNGISCTAESNILTISADVEAPVWVDLVQDITVECDDLPAINPPAATDNQGDPIITYDDDTDSTNLCSIIIQRTWHAEDACGNAAEDQIQIITIVDNELPIASNPTPTTVSCIDNIPTIDISVVTDESDNCSSSPDVAFVSESNNGGAGCSGDAYILMRLYSVTDICGNSIQVSHTITVEDTIPPNASNPADITVECMADATIDITVVTDETDNCTATPLVEHYSDILSGQTCPLTITRTYRITDDCGNYIDVTQSITVEDTTTPVISCPDDVTIDCGDDPNAFGVATATDNCDLDPDITFADTLVFVDCDSLELFKYERIWTATDTCGNESSCIQTITVNLPVGGDVDPPYFTAPPDTTIYKDTDCNYNDAIAFTGDATDVGDNCWYAWPTFDDVVDSTNLCEIIITRTWSMIDVCGNEAADQIQTITVLDSIAPTFIAPSDTTVYYDVDCAFEAGDVTNEADNCDSTLDAIYSDDTDNADPCAVVVTRTWFLEDDCGNSTSKTQIITVIDTLTPVLSDLAPNDTTVNCINNVPLAPTITATDNCSTVDVEFTETVSDSICVNQLTITRNWSAIDICGNSASTTQIITVLDTIVPVLSELAPNDTVVECIDNVPLPPTITATDNCSIVDVEFTETVSDSICANQLIITRNWLATDTCGNLVSSTQIITVLDTIVPVFSDLAPNDTVVECIDNVPLPPTITATDNCSTVDVEFTEAVSDSICANQLTITRNWLTTDACGNFASTTQVITVLDTIIPELFNVPNDAIVECIDDVPLAPTVTSTDNCSTTPVIYSETVSDSICANQLTITRNWSATDICGNFASATQIIIVMDTIVPMLSDSAPNDTTVNCIDNLPLAPTMTATDNCSLVPVVYSETVSDSICANQLTITRNWLATDVCGNFASTTQMITVIDTIVPVLSDLAPNDTTVSCIDNVPLAPTFTAIDNCSAVDVEFTETVSDSICVNQLIITRNWLATDTCGNFSLTTQIITVFDTIAPLLSDLAPNDTIVNCFDNLPLAPTITATDNCSAVDVGFTETVSDSICASQLTITRNWLTTDTCGNFASTTQVITVLDTIAPTFTIPSDTTIYKDADCAYNDNIEFTGNVINAIDNCGLGNVTFVDAVDDADTCVIVIYRTWKIEDDCGNSASALQVITVIDTIPPTASMPLPIIVKCIEDIPEPDITHILNVADNCTSNPIVEFVDEAPDGLSLVRTITRRYSVTDECGNVLYLTQLILINDIPYPINDFDTIDQNSENNIFFVMENDDFGCDGPGEGIIEIVSQPLLGTAFVNNNDSPLNQSDDYLEYTPLWNNVIDDSIDYAITDLSGDQSTATVFIHFIPLPDLSFPEGFSPNGDGINEVYYIRGLFYHPLNSIVIFDKKGNTVFQANPYQNDWDGKNMFNGEPSPQDTYFYILDLGNGLAKVKGFVYLIR